MNVKSICELIEEVAPLALQESYDNAGLLVGDSQMEVTSALVCIDITEVVIEEAIQNAARVTRVKPISIFSKIIDIFSRS